MKEGVSQRKQEHRERAWEGVNKGNFEYGEFEVPMGHPMELSNRQTVSIKKKSMLQMRICH